MNYFRMFTDLLVRYRELSHQKDELEIELAQVAQLMKSTFNLLPEIQQNKVVDVMVQVQQRTLGVRNAIRLILDSDKDTWFTPPDIRDRIKELALPLDLGSNPLAVIGTTLKRLTPDRAESKTLDNGQIAYRAKRTVSLGSLMKGYQMDPLPTQEQAFKYDKSPAHPKKG